MRLLWIKKDQAIFRVHSCKKKKKTTPVIKRRLYTLSRDTCANCMMGRSEKPIDHFTVGTVT